LSSVEWKGKLIRNARKLIDPLGKFQQTKHPERKISARAAFFDCVNAKKQPSLRSESLKLVNFSKIFTSGNWVARKFPALRYSVGCFFLAL
jgi:hypothetical protein